MENEPSSLYPGFSDSIDQVCEEFENAWESKGFPSISAAVTSVSDSGRKNALIELIQIDLERRWRSILQRRSDDPLPRRPLLEDYCYLFSEIGDVPLVLIGQEFRVRWQWGDRPDPETVAMRFPERRDGVLAACRTVLMALGESEIQTHPEDITPAGDASQSNVFDSNDETDCSDWPDPPV